jgi:uroporphyrinogen decarboxylase
MMEFTALDLVLEAMNFKKASRPPVIPLVGLYSSNLTNYSPNQLLKSAEIQAFSQLNALHHFDYDGVLTCMDLTAEAEALGAIVTFQEDSFPYVYEHPIKEPVNIFELLSPSIEDSRLSVFVDTTRILSETVGESHFISSYVVGPFTLSGHLMGVEKLLELTIEEPEVSANIVEYCVSLVKPYIKALVEAGAHNIIILEPTASTSIISPRFFQKYSAPNLKQLILFIHSMNCKATIHICGETIKIIDSMCKTGADALSIDAAINIREAKHISNARSAIIGNVDTTLMLTGTKEQVLDASKKCIQDASDSEGFILSTGCDLPLQTPLENVETMVNTVKLK